MGRPGAIGVHVCACVAWVCACVCVYMHVLFGNTSMFCWCGSVVVLRVSGGLCLLLQLAMHACAWCVCACML